MLAYVCTYVCEQHGMQQQQKNKIKIMEKSFALK